MLAPPAWPPKQTFVSKPQDFIDLKVTGDLPENINFAVKTGALRDFLDNSAVQYQTAEPKQELKTTDIANKARGYTVFISCTAKEHNE